MIERLRAAWRTRHYPLTAIAVAAVYALGTGAPVYAISLSGLTLLTYLIVFGFGAYSREVVRRGSH